MKIDNAHYTSPSQRRALSNIASIAAEGHSCEQALGLVLEELHRLVPWAAMSLSVYDPITRRHRSIASSGYSDETISYLDNIYMSIDPAYRWIVRSNKPYFNWETTEFDYSKSVSARNWWLPGGYSGGSTSYLTSRSNRYIGNLHTSTDSRKHPSTDALQFIDDIAPVLATFVDIWQEPRALLRNLRPDECAAFIDRDGNIQAVPGFSCCAKSEIHELACGIVKKYGNARGIDVLGQRMPLACWHPCDETIHQVQFKMCTRGWLVVHGTTDLPFSLTVRQAEVCSLSALGLTSSQISAVLRLSARTVDRHIENILEKIAASNRAALARLAATTGVMRLSDYLSHG